MQTHEIRDRFTNYFTSRGHTAVPSASLVVDDPNLLFVNAGMVPFKPYFLGQVTPPFGTATSIQKCVRTLDIEEVGITTRHNTFFQMAGNFSFGQYFKEGAITNAWGLLTGSLDDGGFGLDPERLWVTVYENDDEAAKIWNEKIGVSSEHIQRLGMEDNFWSMGVPGPCGPSSEIYYDRGPVYGRDGGPAVDDTRFIEIWNLVFMQDERGEGTGKDDFPILGPLPKKNIDTGLGIERVACILQDVDNVYETDLLRPVIEVAEKLTGARYGAGGDSADDVRFRIIADHTRTSLMLINDGVTPGNEGRGYILRRLIRRIIRSARLMGATGPVIKEFLTVARDTMTPSYPEIADNWDRIAQVAVTEEEAFSKTLEAGTRHFESIAADVTAQGQSVISGETAFQLHDTYGFPIDLTLEMADEAGLSVDQEAFDEHMKAQKARAKADSQAKKNTHADLSVYRPFVDNHPTVFTGYDTLQGQGTILGIITNGELVDAVAGGSVQVILDTTPFYAESGGQMADHGTLTTSSGQMNVNDVQRVAKKVWVHSGTLEGEFAVNQTAQAQVDKKWRHAARQAHSGTHLVHAALRQVLGPNAVQAGSLNRPGYLRFDFKATQALTPVQLQDIENIANEAVDSDYTVNTLETSLDEAKAMGAMALFGENYGNEVRVVEIGGPFSMELCGGIHVEHSSQIGPISITGESSVGSGARRIEAYTGLDSFKHLAQERDIATGLSSALKTTPVELPGRIESLSQKLKDAEKTIQQLHAQQLRSNVDQYLNQIQNVDGIEASLVRLPDDVPAQDIRELVQDVINRLKDRSAVVLFTSHSQGKVPFVAAVTQSAQDKGLKAGDLVKEFSQYVGGSGGGKPTIAQGAGGDAGEIERGLAAVRDQLSTASEA